MPGLARRVSLLCGNEDAKKPGAVFRPGTLREFQLTEYTDSQGRVKRKSRMAV
jgi:hypothetical protein